MNQIDRGHDVHSTICLELLESMSVLSAVLERDEEQHPPEAPGISR